MAPFFRGHPRLGRSRQLSESDESANQVPEDSEPDAPDDPADEVDDDPPPPFSDAPSEATEDLTDVDLNDD